ncbi:hypothetical protein [Pseudomonas viridiflava]|uniref:hypothetical protein n=1 Tax=Pseudomonas viridiflava TaxID=33069 RepID=UPI0013DB5F13|nr:hypothetical protein [Pseudomonas viridiflava]
MANSYVTENLSPTCCHSLDSVRNSMSKHEKISCSISGIPAVDPLGLVGFHVSVDEFLQSETVSYGCVVLGYLSGCFSMGVESKLLLRQDGYEDGLCDEYVPLSSLIVTSIDDKRSICGS